MADTPRETYGTSDERHACPRCVHGERYEHAEWCEAPRYDACQICNGMRGGEPGNENVVNGVIMCDYCHADTIR